MRDPYVNSRNNATEVDKYTLGENYLYISHLEDDFKYWYLPSSPDEISDSQTSTFTETNVLARSAPVFTYSNTGGRQIQVSLNLHRDLMDDVNRGKSNVKLGDDEDYIENLIHAIQAIALPKYNTSNKAVEPPLVAVRIENQVFIKGVVNGAVGLTYIKPILENGKFAQINVSFTVTEVDPYDAQTVFKNGSFRGVVKTLKNGKMGFSE